ncbi:TonB-dependent siderophore receptor [Pseudomonas helleri]|uniref:TonB-dependent siderophore receptor n=1 Tax=Pseudomonas helleri TaxID=1608996 RepID=UPI0028E1BA99|nr:TonB-dependent siderophore receptor [Pseudomonas helleri]
MPSFLRNSPPSLALTASLALAIAASLSVASIATASEQTSVQRFDLPAGPLVDQLNQLAAQSGIYLAGNAALTAGKTGPALHGSYSVEQALRTLLAGSEVTVVQTGERRYQLQPGTGGALELGALSISGKAPGSTTEGTGSYTTDSSSSSTRLNIPLKETPQSITVITQQRIQDQHLTNLTDTLEAVSGITVVREGLGADTDSYYSRGFAINNYEIDGVPTSSRLDNYTQNTAMYDRIEVVRGSTGIISGMGDPSATINMIRKRPTDLAQMSIGAEAGSWDRYGASVDVSGPLTETGNIRGRLVVDYKNQGAWIDRYKQDNNLIYGITEFDLSDTLLLTVGFSYQTQHTNQPPRSGFPLKYSDGSLTDFKRSFNTSADWNYYDHEQSTFFTSLENQFDNGWSGKVEYSRNENKYDSEIVYLAGDIDKTTGQGAYVMPNKFKGNPIQNAVDAYLTGPFQLFGREHELITGVTLSQIRNENAPDYGGWVRPGGDYDGNIGAIGDWNGSVDKPDFVNTGRQDFKENQYAAYLTTRLHLNDDTTLMLGGRVIDWKQDDETRYFSGDVTKSNRRETGVTIPYVGLVYDLSEIWSVYASYTKIFNPQSLQTTTDSYLDPLEGTGYEAGVKAAFNEGRFNTSLALFKVEQDNLGIPDGDNRTQSGWQAYKASKGTTTQGVEWEFNGELGEGWQAAGGYTYSVSTDQDDNRIATQIPRHSFKTFTTYRLTGPLDKLTVGAGINWQSKTGVDLSYYEQKSYAVTNLMARYDITNNLSAWVNLNNVFDKEYYSTTSAGVYGAPRNLMTSLKYNF